MRLKDGEALYSDEMLERMEIYHGNSIGIDFHIYLRNKMPRIRKIRRIGHDAWIEFTKEKIPKYKPEDKNCILWETWDDEDDCFRIHTSVIHLPGGITLYKDPMGVLNIIWDHDSDINMLEKISSSCLELVEKVTESRFGIIMAEPYGLDVRFTDLKNYEVDLIPYMPDEIRDFREQLLQDLQDSVGAGLYLLHGEPGTGKTSFIKSVVAEYDGPCLFITPGFARDLASADLLPILSNYPEAILIIEDAEQVLMKRAQDNASAVSSLLNMSDGFLSDYLNLNIFCTFNTILDDIDTALLRKGRLKGLLEFRKLEPEEANRLADKLGEKPEFSKPVTLAEICTRSNLPDHKNKLKAIGFTGS